MLDVAAAEQQHHYDQTRPSLDDILRDTEYYELDTDTSTGHDAPTKSVSTPSKKPGLSLAIPAGGIDADISDTLSIKSWDSSTAR